MNKQFEELLEDVKEMRIAAVGRDGKGGMKKDMAELKTEIKELSSDMKEIADWLNSARKKEN